MIKLFLFFILILFTGCLTKEIVKTPKIEPVQKSVVNEVKVIDNTPKIQVKNESDLMILKTLNHSTIKLHASGFNIEFITSKYKNKYVILFLFGNDCPHCIKEMPYVKKLSHNPKVKIIGIHAKSMIGDKALRAYIKKVGYNFDILSFSDDIKMIRFLKNSGFWDGGVPYSALVYPDGRVETLSIQEALVKFR